MRAPTGTSDGWNFALALRRDQARHRRYEVEELGDGVPCPADAPGLERQREREEKGHGAGLEPLPDGDRAGDGDGHQEIHVGAQPPQRQPGLRQDRDDSGRDTDGIEETGEERDRQLAAQSFAAEGRAEVAGEERVAEEAGSRRHAGEDGQEQASPPQALAGAAALFALGPPGFGHEPRPAHPIQNGGVGDPSCLRVDRHPAAQQVEAQPRLAADDRPELAPQRSDLLGTIQAGDAEGPRLFDGHLVAAPSPPVTVGDRRESSILPRYGRDPGRILARP